MGLMQAIELVEDETAGNRTPGEGADQPRLRGDAASAACSSARAGSRATSSAIAPALNVERADIEEALAIVRESFEAAGAR